MATRLAPRYNPQDENAAAMSGKSVIPPATIQRPKLSNITNKQQLPSATPKPKNAPLGSKIDTGRTPLRNISNVGEPRATIGGAATRHITPLKDSTAVKPVKQQKAFEKSPKVETRKTHAKLSPGPFSLSEEQESKAEEWAKQGIETVHFTGDEMESLRQKLEHEEMEKRVKAVLSFRTEIFPAWPRSAPTADGPFDSDGKLKLDTYEETSDVVFDEVEEKDVENLFEAIFVVH